MPDNQLSLIMENELFTLIQLYNKKYYTLSIYDLQLRMDVCGSQGDEDKKT